jgi:hypothetical protein
MAVIQTADGQPSIPANLESAAQSTAQEPLPAEPTLSGTRANIIPPENWKDWPVIPVVSERAIEIYRRGIALGNDPHAISIVGDCQAIRDVFLADYDHPNLYHLDAPYAAYQETIDWFHGSFDRQGMAVRGGFTAASILSPMHADPEYCRTGETPLTCEFRLHKPSIVLISLETWSNYKTIDRYEGYLRSVVAAVIERGALPILLTKADVAEVGDGKHYINPAMARVAYDEDLPLANFWKSAQTLPNWGIDPTRDGFHLSEDGFRLKSFTALQALHTVYEAVSAGDPQMTPGSTATAPGGTATPEETVVETTPQAVIPPAKICSPQSTIPSECLVFGLVESVDGSPQDRGVYFFDLASQQMERFGPAGLRLQAVSSDRAFVLANTGPSLYIIPRAGGTPELVSEHFFDFSDQGAVWLPDGSGVVYLARQAGGGASIQLYLRGEKTSQGVAGENPVRLYPSASDKRVYWQQGAEASPCTARGLCPGGSVWSSRLVDSPVFSSPPSLELSGVIQPAFSSDGQHFAFMDPIYDQQNAFNDKLAVEDLLERLPSRRLVVFPAAEGFMVHNRLLSYTWSPDGDNVFILMADHSNYFEKAMVYHTYLFQSQNGWLTEYTRLYGTQPLAVWSPDSRRVLLVTTLEEKDGSFRTNLQILDLATRQVEQLDQNPDLSGAEYRYVENAVWVGDKNRE